MVGPDDAGDVVTERVTRAVRSTVVGHDRTDHGLGDDSGVPCGEGDPAVPQGRVAAVWVRHDGRARAGQERDADMEDVILGVLAILVGLMFCFRGYVAMRVIIAVWGGFAGFTLGAGLVASVGDDGFLRTTLAWIVGFGVALVFALFAYLYYAVSVVLAMSLIGFSIGASVMVALNVSWTWLIVLVGIAGGVLLATLAVVTDLPGFVLIFLSAIGGASVATFGTMLLFGATETADFSGANVVNRVEDDWWWYVLFIVLAIAGMVEQARLTSEMSASIRANWAAERPIEPAA